MAVMTGQTADQVAQAKYERAVAARDQALRLYFQDNVDPLFFKEQRGEVPPGTWESEVAKARELYPKPKKTEAV